MTKARDEFLKELAKQYGTEIWMEYRVTFKLSADGSLLVDESHLYHQLGGGDFTVDMWTQK